MKHAIFEEGHRYEFLQAVRILERLFAEREPVGSAGPPSSEAARFCARLTLAFPPSAIHSVVAGVSGEEPPGVTVNFMGLTGPLGVLPYCYTELLLERAFRKDYALRDFLDLFNHRAISLFYRASTKYRFLMAYERTPAAGVTQYLSDLIGLGTPALKGRLGVNDEALFFYAGLFSQRPRSASGLRGILRDYFEVPVEIQLFVGRWIRLESDNLCRLGTWNCTLGDNIVLGARIWDRQSKFRVRLGPISLAALNSFLPGGRAFEELMRLIRLYAGMEFDFDVCLIPRAEEVPPCRLVSEGETGARLGWSSWLTSRALRIEADDIILACNN